MLLRISPRIPSRGLPVFSVSRRAISSTREAIRFPNSPIFFPRSLGCRRLPSRKALLAAWTALSTSAPLARGTSPSFSPVAGLIVSIVFPDSLSTHSPPIGILWVSTSAMATPPLHQAAEKLFVVRQSHHARKIVRKFKLPTVHPEHEFTNDFPCVVR